LVRFEWDEAKNRLNKLKHGLRFELAVEAFEDPMAVSVQDREVGGEERWQTIGVVRNLRLVVVAHAVRGSFGEEITRIISARKADASERRIYEEGQ
jgi:uncharacterized DUF497 family protein